MTRLASILAALILAPYSLVAPFATTTSNPVSVELISPVDGSTGFLWYNSGTIAAPTWNNV